MNTFARPFAVACAFAALAGVSLAQNRTFTSQYSFGDSLSDNGNLYALTGRTTPPSPPYFNGRFSNGPTFVELLGNPIVPAATLSSRGTNRNFAFGGATAGPGLGGPVPTLAQQIGLYTLSGLPATPTDLFTVLAGANDLIAALSSPATPFNPALLDSAGAGAAQAVAGGVQSLLALGAKNIVVAGLPNLGATPRSLASGGAGGAGATFGLRASTAFNNELTSRLGALAAAAPDVNFVYIDLQGLLDRIILDYRALGYANNNLFVLAPSAQGGGGDPGGYVFFDDIHPTAKTHALLAAVVVEALNPEPVLGFGATVGTAALALQALATDVIDRRTSQLAASNRATGRTDGYATINYADGNRHAIGWRPKFNFNARVATAGVDLHMSDGFFFGGAIDVGRLNATVGGAGRFAVEDQTGRAYGVWRGGPASMAFDVNYGVVNVKNVHRATALGGFETTGKTSGEHWGVGLKAAWSITSGATELRPWAGLRTERVKLTGYSERDVPVLMMAFDEQKARSSAAAVGVDFGTGTILGGRAARFDFRGAWHGEIGSKDRAVMGRLASNFSRSTSVAIRDGDGNGFELGAAGTLFFSKNWSVSLGYVADIRSGDKVESKATLSVQSGF